MVNAQLSFGMVDFSALQQISLANFVQCNILPFVRAVEPAMQANQAISTVRPQPVDGKQATMIKLDEMQKFSKDNMDVALKSFGAVSKAGQAIATEVVDYSKRSFEDSTKVMEKLLGAKSLEKAIEIQTDYAKTAYEGFVAQATKISELYVDLAKETYKPFESYIPKAAATK
jgi:hypothetical protein